MSNCFLKLVFIVILSLVLVSSVNAIGIAGSSSKYINFEPDTVKVFDFWVVQATGKEVETFLQGDLVDYAEVTQPGGDIMSKSRHFTVTLRFPSSLKPGDRVLGVGIEEAISEVGGGMVGGRSRVITSLKIFVPYPGHKLEASLEVPDSNVNEKLDMIIKLRNIGEEKINSVRGVINIVDVNNETLDEITFSKTLNLEKFGEASVSVPLSLKDYEVGSYRAEGKLYYHGKDLDLIDIFKVGELILKIVNITDELDNSDGIKSVDVEVESLWNGIVRNAFAEVEFMDEKVKSSSVTFFPFDRKVIKTFFKFENVSAGEYPVKITLYAEGEIFYKESVINVIELRHPFAFDGVTVGFIVVATIIILLLLFNGLLLLLSMKRKKEEEEER